MRIVWLLLATAALAEGVEQGTGVGVCKCVGTACTVYVRWDFRSYSDCVANVPNENATEADTAAYMVQMTKGSGECNQVLRGNTSDEWLLFDTSSCMANLSSPNQHQWEEEISFGIYASQKCEKNQLRRTVRIPSADGLCRTTILGPGHEDDSEEKWTLRFTLIVCLTPFVTALVGYGTNVIAIKMIFQPYNPKCGFSCSICGPSSKHPGQPKCYWRGLQGVFPKRQYSLAVQIGDMVDKNLISADEMVAKMKSEMGLEEGSDSTKPSGIDEELSTGVKHAVGTMLDKRQDTPGFGMFLMAMGGKDAFRDNLARGTVSAFKSNLPYLMETFASSFTSFIPFKEIITDRIRHKMTPADLEDMFMSFMAAELGFVEQLGGYLGFMVGVLQGCIFIVAGT